MFVKKTQLWLTMWIIVFTQSIILVSDNELASVEAMGGCY